MLGVVLALAANQWREARSHQQDADAAVAAIVAELETNRTAVAVSMAYHGGLLEQLFQRTAADGPPSTELFVRGFVAPAQLSATAWEVAAETGVLSHVRYPIVLGLSHAYSGQHHYAAQAEGVGQLIYGELYRNGPDAVAANYRNLASLIGAFAYRERELLAVYDSTLALVRNGSADDPP